MTKFIAEISSNHSTDLERCKKFIDVASEIGCYAVKFQLFEIEKLFVEEVLKISPDHLERKKWELPKEYIPELSNYSRQKNLKFSCTPFFLEAVDILKPYVDFFKIASYELLWVDLIKKCSETKMPLIISTGMADIKEVDNAVKISKISGCRDLTLLQCVSHYPASFEDVNLKVLNTYRDRYRCKVGWSDHTVNSGVIHRAVHKWGATTVEFHLDLEGFGEEFTSGHCWLPHTIKPVIESIKNAREADGTGIKAPTPSEMADRSWRADPTDGLRPFKDIRASF